MTPDASQSNVPEPANIGGHPDSGISEEELLDTNKAVRVLLHRSGNAGMLL